MLSFWEGITRLKAQSGSISILKRITGLAARLAATWRCISGRAIRCLAVPSAAAQAEVEQLETAVTAPTPTPVLLANNLNVALRKPPSKIQQPLHNHAHVFNVRSVTAGKALNYMGRHLNKIPRKYKPTTQLFPEKETLSKLSKNIKTYSEVRSELYFSLFRDSSSHISFSFWKPQIMQSFSSQKWALVL